MRKGAGGEVMIETPNIANQQNFFSFLLLRNSATMYIAFTPAGWLAVFDPLRV